MQKSASQNIISRKSTARTSDDEASEKQRLDMELDRQLEATFPASDALKVTLRHSGKPTRVKRLPKTKR